MKMFAVNEMLGSEGVESELLDAKVEQAIDKAVDFLSFRQLDDDDEDYIVLSASGRVQFQCPYCCGGFEPYDDETVVALMQTGRGHYGD